MPNEKDLERNYREVYRSSQRMCSDSQYPRTNFFYHDQYHRFLDGREEPLNLAKRYQGMIVPRQLFRNCPFATSAVVCRRDWLVQHGMFNERLMSALRRFAKIGLSKYDRSLSITRFD
ncbi:hypothetical protein HYW17_03855 [Candidatus Uhrbacteria bacterium]|nr:hypothetical protein [Candidatus Uhrbacteria bacterium]